MATDKLTDLASVQAVELKMLAALDNIAEEAGLRYFVAYGTALGAVRDRRQIPWDWDMDVLVPIPDYDLLVSRLKDSLPPGLCISDEATEPGYGPLFARITVKGQDHDSVHLDLFPLVGAPSGRRVWVPLIKFNHMWSRIHVLRAVRPGQRLHHGRGRRVAVKLIRTLSWPIPQHVVRRIFWWVNDRWSYDATTWVFNPCGSYGSREFFPTEWFREHREGELSGVGCRLPIAAEEMLAALYGDYLTPSPEEDQQDAYEFFDSYVRPTLADQGSTTT